MAYFDEKRGDIVLSREDKEMFDEIKASFQPTGGVRTPIANRIMKWILPDNLKQDDLHS